jgi:hypothetical protein
VEAEDRGGQGPIWAVAPLYGRKGSSDKSDVLYGSRRLNVFNSDTNKQTWRLCKLPGHVLHCRHYAEC